MRVRRIGHVLHWINNTRCRRCIAGLPWLAEQGTFEQRDEPVYDAFMSYSHAVDGMLAPRLQSALHRFAKPWYRLRALHVFRDKTSLAANPALWSGIQAALDGSQYFLLLASPQAAASVWVRREVVHWLAHHPADSILIVLTGGEISWAPTAGDFDWRRTDALPDCLAGVFEEEPLYVDLRWAKGADHLSLQHPEFRAAVADLAAPLHGRPRDEIAGEDVRAHRRSLGVAWSAVATLLVLLASTAIAAYQAIVQRDLKEQQRQVALARQLAAQAELERSQRGAEIDRSVLLALESVMREPSREGEETLRRGVSLLPHPVAVLAHDSTVNVLAFNADATLLASGAADGTVRVHSTADARLHAQMAHGADGYIVDLEFAHAGNLLASAGGDGAAVLWDADSGEPLARFAHGEGVSVGHVAFSGDGARLATAADDGTARIWSVASGRELARVTHEYGVVDLAWNAADTALVTTSIDGFARVWDASDGRALLALDHGTEPSVVSARFSPDGRQLATATRAGNVRVWDVARGTELLRVHHGDEAMEVRFSPDGRALVSVALDGGLRVWDLPDGRERYRFEDLHWSVSYSADGRWLAAASKDDTARVLEAASGREILRVPHDRPVTQVLFGPRGRYLASASEDRSVALWRVEGDTRFAPMRHGSVVQALSPSPDARHLATAGDDGEVAVWDLDTSREVARVARYMEVNDLGFTVDGRHLLVAGGAGLLRVWGPGDGVDVRSVPVGAAGEWLSSIDVGRAGDLLAAGFVDGRILVADTSSGLAVARFDHGAQVQSVALSPTGERLVSGGIDGVARVWSLSGGEVARLDHASDSVSFAYASGSWVVAVAFTPDGQRVVTASDDGTARLWNLEDGSELRRFEHDGAVNALALDADGRYLATASDDRSARVWELGTGRELTRMQHDAGVERVAFIAGDTRLATATVDGTVGLWAWRLSDRILQACERVTRNLTDDEWARFLPAEPRRPTCPPTSGRG